MQHGGSSGSPIVYEHDPTVVGMMAPRIPEVIRANDSDGSYVAVPTNISIVVPAHLLYHALESFRETYDKEIDRSCFPTFAEWCALESAESGQMWDVVDLP
jgi:hypothetical protein